MTILQFPQPLFQMPTPLKSRADRWVDAAANSKEEIGGTRDKVNELIDVLGVLRSVQEEYQDCRDSLPVNFIHSPLAEKVKVCSLGIESILDELDKISSMLATVESVIDKATSIDLPRGFGRD